MNQVLVSVGAVALLAAVIVGILYWAASLTNTDLPITSVAMPAALIAATVFFFMAGWKRQGW